MTITLNQAMIATLGKLQAVEPRQAVGRLVTGGGGSDTEIQINGLGYRIDDSFVDTHWLVLPEGHDGASLLEAQRVSGFDQDDGSGNTVVTVSEPFSDTVNGGTEAYVSPVHPQDLIDALNNAAPMLYPFVAVPRRYHHVNASRAFNGFFDFWRSGQPEWWSLSNVGLTLTRDPHAYFGESSVKLVADGSERYIYTNAPNHNLLNELAGHEITFHAYLWADTASKIGVRIRDGGGAQTTVYHDGDSKWQQISTAQRTIVTGTPSDPIRFEIVIAASATGYASVAWTTGGPAQEILPIPPQFRRGPSSIRTSHDDWPTFKRETDEREFRLEQHYPTYNASGTIVSGNVAHFEVPSQGKRLLYLAGEDYLSEATNQDDVYELDAPLDELLYVAAIVEIKQAMGQDAGSGSAEFQLALKRDWEATLEKMLDRPAMRVTHPGVSMKPMFSGPGYGGSAPDRYSVK